MEDIAPPGQPQWPVLILPLSLYPRPFLIKSYRFFQVIPGELAILSVVVQDRTELKMSSRFDPLRRLELKNGLEAMHAKTNLRGARCPKMFRKTQQGKVPRLRGLSSGRHFNNNNNNSHATPVSFPAGGDTVVFCC